MSNVNPTPNSKFARWAFTGNRPALLLLGIVVCGVVWMVAANNLPKQELCHLFDGYQPTFAEQNRILTALGTTELTGYEVEAGQIRVPKNLKGKFLAAIAEKDAMPEDLVKKSDFQPNLFLPRSQLKLQQLQLKKKKISEMIKSLPFVADARFEFDRTESRELFQPQQQSAVAMVTPRSNSSLDLQQLQSIQRTVASAIAGIHPHEVAVIDTHSGIAYDDIRQLDQAKLIQLMNWKTKRREHYQRLLYTTLSPEFPGLEIDVQVQASIRETKIDENAQHQEKTHKLAAQSHPTKQPIKVGLNTTTTVSVEEVANPTADNLVRKATYEAILPHARRTVGDGVARIDLEPYTEKLMIKITVPIALIQSETSHPDAQIFAEQFQRVSARISELVKLTVPQNALSDSLPVEVIPQEAIAIASSNESEFLKLLTIQKFWPLWAILIAGLVTVFVFRSSDNGDQEDLPSNEGPSSLNPETELDLESQLTELIDNDPAAAAKVLRNWIQQDH